MLGIIFKVKRSEDNSEQFYIGRYDKTTATDLDNIKDQLLKLAAHDAFNIMKFTLIKRGDDSTTYKFVERKNYRDHITLVTIPNNMDSIVGIRQEVRNNAGTLCEQPDERGQALMKRLIL